MVEMELKKGKSGSKKIDLSPNKDWRTKISFNFSYLVSDKKYNHTQLEHKVRKKLIEKLCILSTEDFVVIKSWSKDQGFEKMPITKLKPPSSFISSGRDDKAGEDFWVFRLNMLGRVICKRIETTFYIIAIDTTFDLYDH